MFFPKLYFLVLALIISINAQPKLGVGIDEDLQIYPPFKEQPNLWD